MKKVFIYGGCTSRDAVDYYPDYSLELEFYVARQSLISAFHPADPKDFVIASDTRPFQKRMLHGDIVGNLRQKINHHAENIDLFVWDLMIERVGVRPSPSGGIVTRNGVPLAPGAPAAHQPYIFGTPEHLAIWKATLDRFIHFMSSLGLRERMVINATPWATHDENGQKFESKSKSTPEWFNGLVTTYWDLAHSRGVKVARVPQSKAIADRTHKWGPAYFHYVPDTYKYQLDTITSMF